MPPSTSRRAVLHVGAMKSGTSYLQNLLYAQQDRLAANGVLLPGHDFNDVVRAVRQALGRVDEDRPLWDATAAALRAHPGHSVLSMEYLGPVTPRTARRIVRDLRGAGPGEAADQAAGTADGPEPLVVLTVRDLNRNLVSMWQETVQNGRSWTWEEYLASAREEAPGAERPKVDRSTPGGTFWRQQDLVRIAGLWTDAVGVGNVVVVTVPPPGADRTLLARRFSEAAGFDVDPHAPVPAANESLGLASVLALMRLNVTLDAQGLPFPQGTVVRKKVLAKQILAARRSVEPGLGLDVEPWVREQSAATVAGLRDLGVVLVGDWADLDPVPVPGVRPADVDESAISDALLAGLAGLVLDRARRSAD